MPNNPDWTALQRDPNFALFFDSEPVARIERDAVQACVEGATTFDAVQYHRGILAGIEKLRQLPELQEKRAGIKAGQATVVAGGPTKKEAARPAWWDRLTKAWRALRADEGGSRNG